MSFPRVSIIILNWNGWKDTIECLESLYQITYPNYDVVVVDNGSEDESVQKIKEYCKGKIKVEAKFFKYNLSNKPIYVLEYTREQAGRGGDFRREKYFSKLPSDRKLRLILNEKNYGFAEGNNIAIRYILKALDVDYILLLNNDTVVDKEFLSELVKVGESDEKIGIVGAINYYYDDPERIWYSGGVVNWVTGKLTDITGNKIDSGQFEKIREVDDVAGSSLLIKVKVVEEIGLLHSDYFCYYEETEWCIKAKRKKYLVFVNLNSKIWHKISSSSRKIPEFERYYLTRNRFKFMYRNATKLQFISFFIYFLLVNLTLNVALVLHGNLKCSKILYKAIYDEIKTWLSSKGEIHWNKK